MSMVMDARGGDSIGDAQSLMGTIEDYRDSMAATDVKRVGATTGIEQARNQINHCTDKLKSLDLQQGKILHDREVSDQRSAGMRQASTTVRRADQDLAGRSRELQNRMQLLQTANSVPTYHALPASNTWTL